MSARRSFDPLALPLTGVQIVEASAGTGKTHSLIALFLRAVAERGLRAEQVLMVTFTEAATADLRQRLDAALRRVLRLAAWTADDAHEPYAPLLATIVARVGDAALVRARLMLAAQSLDQAAIQTIHAFCRRALRECAFEAGSDFADPAPGAQGALWLEATRDWWQARQYRATTGEVATWQRRLSPRRQPVLERLAAIVRDLAPIPGASLRPLDLAARAEEAERAVPDAVAALRAQLDAASIDAARDRLATTKAISRDKSKGLPPDRADAAFAALLAWRDAGTDELPEAASCLAADWLRERMLKSASAFPAHELFDAIERVCRATTARDVLRHGAFVRDAVDGIRALVQQRQAARGSIGFDDLIERLATALADEGAGARLAAALRERYPLALVDEFQDTDPRQYAIFRTLYRAHDDAGLVLIGDPKQAIYRFRGGDVYAYQIARADSRGAVHTLDTNRRSDARVVAAVNAVFAATDAPFRLDFVPFEAVAASAARDGALHDPEEDAAAIAWLHPAEKPTVETLERDGAERCADEIARLVAGGRAGTITIGARALRASDLAVLVPTNAQADLVRGALARRGVAVAAVARDSVLETSAADDVAAWLAALASGNDRRALRAALASSAIAADQAALADAGMLETWGARFADAAATLRRDGLFAALWPIAQAAAPGLLARPGGAAQLAHLRHLIEWLATQLAGPREPRAVLAWLTRRRDAPDPDDAAEATRAQDEGDRVRVLTIHKSKGLEFGCVFLPFAWRGARDEPREPLRWHEADGTLVVDLVTTGGDARARAQQEEFDEDVRLAYVALTRAIHRVHVVFAPAKAAPRSGLGQLLAAALGAPIPSGDALVEAWSRAFGPTWSARTLPPPGPPMHLAPERAQTVAAAQARTPAWPQWHSHSFSSLHHQADAAALPTADHDQWVAFRDEGAGGAMSRREAAEFGDCFHEVMEALVAPTPRLAPLSPAARIEAITQQYALPAARGAEIAAFASATMALPLAMGVELRTLAARDRIVEMPFTFAIDAGGFARAAAVLRDEPGFEALAAVLAATRPALRSAGQMRGYIDLVVRLDGRYHVLDYKTNRLPSPDDYRDDGLRRAMREHGYDLQALIYAVALHRALRERLGDGYDPARDFGGAIYLFVRGAQAGDGIHRERYAPALLDALDHAFAERRTPA